MSDSIQRKGSLQAEGGVFRATLATGGEADDGHILDIGTLELPEKLPMVLQHAHHPTQVLGHFDNLQRDTSVTPPVLRGTGHFLTDGQGAEADRRRDLALMVERGLVRGVSIFVRAGGTKPVRRTDLPEGHPAHVPAGERGKRALGEFIAGGVADEASIVFRGADPAALVGRALETEGEVAAMWRSAGAEAALEQAQDAARFALDLNGSEKLVEAFQRLAVSDPPREPEQPELPTETEEPAEKPETDSPPEAAEPEAEIPGDGDPGEAPASSGEGEPAERSREIAVTEAKTPADLFAQLEEVGREVVRQCVADFEQMLRNAARR